MADDTSWRLLPWQANGGPFLHWDEELAQISDGSWALFMLNDRGRGYDHVLGVLGRHRLGWQSHKTQSILSFPSREAALRLLPRAVRHFNWPDDARRAYPQLGSWRSAPPLHWLSVPRLRQHRCGYYFDEMPIPACRRLLLPGFDGLRLSERVMDDANNSSMRQEDLAQQRRDAIKRHAPDYAGADGSYCLIGDSDACPCGAVATYYGRELMSAAARRSSQSWRVADELPRRVCADCFPALQPIAERLWQALKIRQMINKVERTISEHNRKPPGEVSANHGRRGRRVDPTAQSPRHDEGSSRDQPVLPQ